MNSFRYIFGTIAQLWSLLVGLKVTGLNFMQRQVTVHYPRKTVDNLSTFRSHVELVGKPKSPAEPKCIACMMCANVCPSGCFTIKKLKAPKPKEGEEKPKAKKGPATVMLDFNYCSLCGLCVQSCPVGSLRFTTDAYLSGVSRQEFVYDLMDRLKKQAATGAPQPEAEGGES